MMAAAAADADDDGDAAGGGGDDPNCLFIHGWLKHQPTAEINDTQDLVQAWHALAVDTGKVKATGVLF